MWLYRDCLLPKNSYNQIQYQTVVWPCKEIELIGLSRCLNLTVCPVSPFFVFNCLHTVGTKINCSFTEEKEKILKKPTKDCRNSYFLYVHCSN